MPKRHQKPVLVFRELKPKFAVSAREVFQSPGSCELKLQAVPGLAQDSDCCSKAAGKVWSVPTLQTLPA